MALSPLTGNGWIKEDSKLLGKHAVSQEKSGSTRCWCRSDMVVVERMAYHVADVQAVKT